MATIPIMKMLIRVRTDLKSRFCFRCMNALKKACLILFFLYCCCFSFAQDVGDPEKQSVTTREWDISAFLNTSGGGVGFQYGWTPDHYNKHFWEIDFLYNKHPKSVRGSSSIPGSTPYAFGKLYDLFFLRGGYGYQRILNHKPYWGGVELRYTLSAGFTLGMGVPVYLRIITNSNEIEVERYDPDRHTIDRIYGNAGFLKGIWETALRPGFYGKTGLRFDFSKKELNIHVLEIGVSIDMVFPFIRQMAFIKAKPLYFSAYIGYHFGKKREVFH